jgi:CubicO group peptidase (beta-lactamase class C family)
MLQRFFPDAALVDRKTARNRLLQIEPERQPGSEVVYSCTGFQILGEVLAAAAGAPLDVLHARLVAAPLGLESTRYAPPDAWRERCAGTELCRWRDRWVRGEVHDESAYAMEGVAGNAGLFSTADEVLAMSELYRRHGTVPTARGTYTLASVDLFERAEKSHTDGKAQRRGLGLQLNSTAADGAEAAGGPDLSRDSYGHTGFTGTSFWVDPARDLTVVAMTNRLQFGRDQTADAIKRFRRELHSASARIYPSFSA